MKMRLSTLLTPLLTTLLTMGLLVAVPVLAKSKDKDSSAYNFAAHTVAGDG